MWPHLGDQQMTMLQYLLRPVCQLLPCHTATAQCCYHISLYEALLKSLDSRRLRKELGWVARSPSSKIHELQGRLSGTALTAPFTS